ncbi:hypothetical protein ACFQ05_02365 [Amycolatopsis umgeniensis]|uniref:Uncharacterized protein n=1 Tax=Amycolatopsis umgeniensis TaxID=336628 RepID=A0A841B0G0_9PSEU|nr:hypothetical protein [Amycolatopsis umgeniensis]MBB5852102.1 hypothetical protein [Amycolatopsis umgeniensis]
MKSSQSQAIAEASGSTVLARLFVTAGALLGFVVLAVLMSGAADAAEKPAEPDDHAFLGNVLHPVHELTSEMAPVVERVTKPVEPVVSPVVRPVVKAVEPVLNVVRPVTGPVTKPLVRTLAPITHVVGADPVADAVTGTPARPVPPAPRADVSPEPLIYSGPQARKQEMRVPAMPRASAVPLREYAAERTSEQDDVQLSAPSGHSDGGGPALPAGPGAVQTGGTMTAGGSGAHGGDHAVTETGSGMPGTDRAWRAPPDDRRAVPWPDDYGIDHPS